MAIKHFVRGNWKWLGLAVIVVVLVLRIKLAGVPAQAGSVSKTNVVAEVFGTGTLEARIKATISPRIQERLQEVCVDQGEVVRAGQLLARLDAGEIQSQVEVAEAALAGAQATAERVRVDETRAQAVARQAQLDHQRITELLQTRVSSQAEMDKAVEQLRVAESELEQARAATVEARHQAHTAEKNLAYQRERLGFTTLTSPFDGLITRRDRDPGSLVLPGTAILQLVATNELWISAWVDEIAAPGLAVGQPARVVFRAEPAREYPGTVARLGRETDRETREFLVDVRVTTLPANWTIGQRAEVFIETGRKSEVLAVAHRFLHWQDGRAGVFVAAHDQAIWREVTLGLRGRELTEICSGLNAGDKVVAPANPKQLVFQSGQRISVR
jgi:HlyD family secretion protein